jgi:hypothetical protein
MQARRTLVPGQKGATKFLDRYREQLVCARYRWFKQAGGKWNSTKRAWEIHCCEAVALGLKKRIVKLEVSDIRHRQVSNTRHSQVSSIGR